MKRMILATSVLALLAGTALALPGPNSMGVFVDAAPATSVGPLCVTKASGPIDIYLCLMNPDVPGSAPTQVSAYELSMSVPGGSQLFGSWDLFGGVNIGDLNDWSDLRFIVGTGASPLTPDANNVVTLAHFSGFLGGTAPIAFQLRGFPDTQSFPDDKTFGFAADEFTLVPCTALTGGTFDAGYGAFVSNWVLVINNDGTYDDFCNGPVNNDDTTWSSVKGLYR